MSNVIPGRRATKQKAAVVEALAAIDDFRSAQEIHAWLRDNSSAVGLTTVYRTLQALADTHEVDALRTADGEMLYRRCASDSHHHHLVCRQCGKTVEVEGPAVESWADQTAQQYGFADVSHTLEIFGTCEACAESN